MSQILNFLIGIIILILGIPFGNYLSKITKEELKVGQIWFKLIIFFGLIGGFLGFISKNDTLMFSMFFISIVTSRSLLKNKNDINKIRSGRVRAGKNS